MCESFSQEAMAHLCEWLTKCKWKCDNDRNRGTGNAEALEQKCCQVESKHRDTSFDTLRSAFLHDPTVWPCEEVARFWNIERAVYKKVFLQNALYSFRSHILPEIFCYRHIINIVCHFLYLLKKWFPTWQPGPPQRAARW